MSTSNVYAEGNMKTNYTLSFNSNDALCFVKINDMLVMDNVGMYAGQFTMGRTISGYLQNGENTLSIAMLHNKEKEITDDMWCSAKIKNVREIEPVSGVKLVVNDGTITPDKNYHPKGIASFGDSPRVNKTEKRFREVSQSFYASDLPDWAWTTATPVTEKDIPAIKEFYESLQNDFKQQDLNALYQKTEGMWRSLAMEQGSTPQKMWDSMDFTSFFDKGYKAVPIDWDGFELNSYMKGRIFRFEKGYGRASPLKIKNKEGEVFILVPYLSLIDGKVTVVK
ncbi:MAG: hypothetical protein KA732_12150 [Providencia sp.]|uniref:hypothetical protein n=1 Tax=Providencia sp. TaxID=589 RepID=UPI001B474AFA|nr:hypothetical protein [Providencia sp.]